MHPMAGVPDAYALLDALFAHAPVGLGFWDRELRYARINAALAALNGVAPDDHLGRTPTEVLGPLGADVERLLRRVGEQRIALVDVAVGGETPAAPGIRREWLASYYPVIAEDGELLGVAGVVIEITAERRATERARAAVTERRTTAALLDAIFAAAPIGIAYLDAELRYRRVNDALGRTNGVPAADHLGRTPAQVLGRGVGEEIEALLRGVVETGEPVVEREIARPHPSGQGTQYRSSSYYPVYGIGGQVVGVGGVVRDVTAQHEAEAERARLLEEAVAARAEAERASRRTEILARAGERLAAVTVDFERTLQEVARVAVPAIADWCTFVVLEPEGGMRVAAVAATDEKSEALARELSGLYPPRRDSPAGVGLALRSGQSQLVEQISEELVEAIAYDAEHLRILRSLGLRSGLTVPLVVRDRTIGALTLVYAESGRRYGPDDVTLAESLAARAALAVENARLLAERSHIAQTLQRSLLPPALPDVPGLDLAARYRAAGDQNEVGGDFYDAFATSEGTWTLLIGDVAGKGAEAAALTSLTRHTLRAAGLRNATPGESLRLLNDALWNQSTAGARFCTVLTVSLRSDGAGGMRATLATGGHLPPAIVRADGAIDRPDVRGSLVGGLRNPRFDECTTTLAPGDVLVLFTDGVTELRAPGTSRVGSGAPEPEATLAALRGAPADAIVAGVERRMVELQHGLPRDDIALLAVRARA